MQTTLRTPAKAGLSSRNPCIYAYCHIRTNQVLYSVRRTLENSQLKQLADAGANNNPPKLRKDLWRPLYTVRFPESEDGPHYVQELFRLLREYRMLHETTWEIPDEMKRPYTEKEIHLLQKKLDNRGGSKIETVFDIIKREKHKMRQKMVMNQKANSVADLAHILNGLSKKGAEIAEKKMEQDLSRRESSRKEMWDLARRNESREPTELKNKIVQLKVEMTKATNASQNKQLRRKDRGVEYQRAKNIKQELEDTQQLLEKMAWSANAITTAKAKAKAELMANKQKTGEMASSTEAVGEPYSVMETTHGGVSEPKKEEIESCLPDFFPSNLDPIQATMEGAKSLETNPRFRKFARDIKLARAVAYSMKGVSIKWADVLDASYAEEWPEDVQHESLGIFRHSAPAADAKPIEDVAEFRGLHKKKNNSIRNAKIRAAKTLHWDIVKDALSSPARRALQKRLKLAPRKPPREKKSEEASSPAETEMVQSTATESAPSLP